MRSRPFLALALALLAAAPALAGCFTLDGDGRAPSADDAGNATGTSPGNASKGTPPPPRAVTHAPWWTEGRYFDITFEGADRPSRSHRLVVFLNETDTDHFWLGVEDRAIAREHAFHDTNPFLGRIHHDVLSPHESGQHAGMFNFPLVDGKHWTGFFFGRDWDFTATADPATPGRFDITGNATDGATLRLDYDPDVKWWRSIHITGPDGARELTAEVTAHGTGARGTYWFERGRDYYAGPEVREGPHSETFEVTDEGLDLLAVSVDVTTSAPFSLEIVDPAGEVRDRLVIANLTGGTRDETIEIPAPAPGEWTVRYVTPGRVDGTILSVGIHEYSGTV